MAASYPGSVKSFTPKVDDVDDVNAADVNELQLEITAIETELGADVAGTAATLLARLARSLDGLGNLDFATSTELTISSGAITPTQNYHTVDTEADAATDYLDTIANTNVSDGFILFLRQNNDSRDVEIRHATGNIKCPGAANISMASTLSVVVLIYDATLTAWLALPAGDNAGVLNAANTWTGKQTHSAGMRYAYTGISANTTLSTSHHVVNADATSGSIVVTLPTAASISGTEYFIRKSDSGSLVVNVSGSASETISGSSGSMTSFDIGSQYKTYRLMSDGTNWMVLGEY